MFNESVKLDYIQYNPNNNLNFERVMTNYFNRAEESELRYGKDLGSFTSAEIMGMYKSFCTPSLSMLVVINNQFLNYANWYLKKVNRGDNQNHYREMRDDILLRCVFRTPYSSNILTRDELMSLIKDFANPYEQFLYLALFEGVKGEQMSDFFDLRVSDFDSKKKTLQLPGREIEIVPELIHYAEESADEYIIYNINGEPTRRGRFLEEDDRIIKCSKSVGFETDKEERTRIVYRMMRKTKRYDFVPRVLSITSLMESGRVDWITQRLNGSVEDTIRNNKTELENKYGVIPSIPKWLLKYESYCKR